MADNTEKNKETNVKTEDQQAKDTGYKDEKPPVATEKAREISTKEAYFASLNEWVKHANISQNAMALFPWYLLSSYPQVFQSQGSTTTSSTTGFGGAGQPPPTGTGTATGTGTGTANGVNANAAQMIGFGGGLRILSDQQQAEIINRTGGYEYVIAPFWKRAIAEMIDMLILLLLKIIVTFMVMNIFDLDLGFDLDKEVLRKAIDDDDYTGFLAVSMDFLSFSSDLLMLEVLTKIIVCFYEAIWTTWHSGSTPGKAFMDIRIQYVEAVLPLQLPQVQVLVGGFPAQRNEPKTALIFPAEVPTFQRALMRAVAKNLIITLLFPMCFIMIFFKNNRTAYDIITKTIVVESNPNPVLRRPR